MNDDLYDQLKLRVLEDYHGKVFAKREGEVSYEVDKGRIKTACEFNGIDLVTPNRKEKECQMSRSALKVFLAHLKDALNLIPDPIKNGNINISYQMSEDGESFLKLGMYGEVTRNV